MYFAQRAGRRTELLVPCDSVGKESTSAQCHATRRRRLCREEIGEELILMMRVMRPSTWRGPTMGWELG